MTICDHQEDDLVADYNRLCSPGDPCPNMIHPSTQLEDMAPGEWRCRRIAEMGVAE